MNLLAAALLSYALLSPTGGQVQPAPKPEVVRPTVRKPATVAPTKPVETGPCQIGVISFAGDLFWVEKYGHSSFSIRMRKHPSPRGDSMNLSSRGSALPPRAALSGEFRTRGRNSTKVVGSDRSFAIPTGTSYDLFNTSPAAPAASAMLLCSGMVALSGNLASASRTISMRACFSSRLCSFASTTAERSKSSVKRQRAKTTTLRCSVLSMTNLVAPIANWMLRCFRRSRRTRPKIRSCATACGIC